MSYLKSLVADQRTETTLDSPAARQVAQQLAALTGGKVYASSLTVRDGVVFFIFTDGSEKRLGLVWAATSSPAAAADFAQQGVPAKIEGVEVNYKLCPLDPASAAALRKNVAFAAPSVIGLKKSVGLGDRLGLATPGHVRAVLNTDVAPVFAQQSIRELARTERTAQEVIDAATWGVFEAGWRAPYGADADHLKSTEDIDTTLAAGFRMFTIDPSEHVDNQADDDPPDRLAAKFEALPWDDLGSSPADWRRTYSGKTFTVPGDLVLRFEESDLLRAAVKYGAAVAHTARLARHLASCSDQDYELEMSVDETTTPTSLLEHFFVANELKRLDVRCVSLAPRFVGDFEKGVDYKGDLHQFETQFIGHVKICKHLGPYKISIHSGSDKFTAYPIVARHAGDLVHVKTAGTSYLEGLRVVAARDPGVFREILDFARSRFDTDKATYHISVDMARVPATADVKDGDLADLIDAHDSRQMLHVTFGSVLTWRAEDGGWLLRDRVLRILAANEQLHYDVVAKHLARHVQPFAGN
jgi:hypothetical protein